MSAKSLFRALMSLTCVLAVHTEAPATWSIVLADKTTGEIAVGTVTCLTSFDLLAIVPVIVVEKGAAAVQASGDFDGLRRPIIFDAFIAGTAPADILSLVAAVPGHSQRQYGIADTVGRMVTFSGSGNLQWAGGVTGTFGSTVYAIQGNILAGACVVPAIEQAVVTTDGDIPTRLMAGMQAARTQGGDGRCSCSSFAPTSCGCPPGSFSKVGHIGGMVVARVGDVDDTVCNASGCADGDYFMRLNVSFQSAGAPDPVVQLQTQFDTWRNGLIDRPDAVHSVVTVDPPVLPPDGTSTATMTVVLRDWGDQPASVVPDGLQVVHGPGSAGASTIGAVSDQGGGVFSVVLTAGTLRGMDRFRVTADDGVRPVVLTPDATLDIDFGSIPAVSDRGMRLFGALAVGMAVTIILIRRKRTEPA